jgi:hypothetical protein
MPQAMGCCVKRRMAHFRTIADLALVVTIFARWPLFQRDRCEKSPLPRAKLPTRDREDRQRR